MFHKLILVICGVLVLTSTANAENNDICKAAKDSMGAQFKRGEWAFYAASKTNPSLYNFIKISKNYYEKIPVRVAPGIKDTSKLQVNKMYNDFYEKKAYKTQPLDTSSEFKKCYNAAFQPKLDSIFKCDFFRKSDSILQVYDKSGRGYSGVDFPGGAGALQKYLDKNISFPKDVKPNDSDKAYRVFYSFFVDEKGAISEIQLVKSNCKACEQTVLDAIHKLPAFIPAKDAGKPKRVKYIMPFIKAYVKPKE